LLPPGQRPSGPAAAAELDIRIIPVEINAPTGISNGVYFFIYFKFLSSKSFFERRRM